MQVIIGDQKTSWKKYQMKGKIYKPIKYEKHNGKNHMSWYLYGLNLHFVFTSNAISLNTKYFKSIKLEH